MAFADRRCKTASPNPSTTTTTPGLSRQDSREGRQDNDDTSTWDYMAQTSAFHGVGKIRSAPNRCLKVLWLLCLLGMTSAMVYQLIKLTTTFFAFPVKTSVNLAFSPLLLPAITVCNSNPLRLTKVRTLNCPLQSFLRVEDQYKSPECVNETTSLRNDPVVLCERFNMFCSANNTEDVNMFALRKKRTQLEIVKENRTVIKAAGHQIEDLIIDCNFAGLNCFARSFSREWTMEYGNCFTMNTTLMQAFDSGPPSV
ncbi:acid-sensing ion channel 5-like [Littorina saxatilis]|uniref:acid-sensing ion channel 5-like n=1 Tax=Littorina saxatilis TaxID=31220 RepID=UPI0038B5A29C